jgi:hypothetical protein
MRYEKLMPLYLITYQSEGRLAGLPVVSAGSEADARMHAVQGIGDASQGEVYALDPENAAVVPTTIVGKMLLRREAIDLLHRMAHAVGQVQF